VGPTVPTGTGPRCHRQGSAIRCIVSTEWFGATEQSASTKGTSAIDPTDRAATIEAIIAGLEDLMRSLAELHAPEFLEIAVTMPQAKLLYLLGVSGEMHMSELVTRLGVSLSTVSGLVDRVVDHGLATRREDPADRRQVVVSLTESGTAFIDRFRDLNAVQMRELLGVVADDELVGVRNALDALARAADRLSAVDATASRKEPA
jgi:DNA-binding MarR family transcriptional regulator